MGSNRVSFPLSIPVPLVLKDYPANLCGVELRLCDDLSPTWAEIGGEGFWSLSSAKEGNGVNELRDNNPNTFWQSDGSGPHTITIQFRKMMRISRIDLLLNYKADESYTPKVVVIRMGYTERETFVVMEAEFDSRCSEQRGDTWWAICFDPMEALKAYPGYDISTLNPEEMTELKTMFKNIRYLEAFCIQLIITQNYTNGKDSHIRQIRIYGPANDIITSEQASHLPFLPNRGATEEGPSKDSQQRSFRNMII
ncbi:anaphase-promoting complex subunit APC10 [Cardiosporidium cionae]|uniref:Anaphase-promoting complex subunit APC10 n=1 Tax=Cardiosporidium cionae TaxID=476202 RepID=A0ABQ7J650_9APIC|nr:anaphase-promoting complex subunit APC10 [Cardiosporidium cionae]|eukprot:KAF8819484.1 anaphase-promoting complex subunit APC10 [Cardiosporidium cionae]